LFDNPDAALQFMAAGNDMMMICAHWADTERVRPLAKRIIEGRRSGELDPRALERSRERVIAMLDRTAQNDVRALSEDVFQQHAEAGALFSDETAEVI
jgi:beta-N-acetylhexosaminidase